MIKKGSYKAFQGVINIWCKLKWRKSETICAEATSVDTADVIAALDGQQYAFVFTLNKSEEEAQTQLANCRPNFERIYLVTNEVDVDTIPKQADDIYILNLADRYGLGNMVEELWPPRKLP